MSVYETLKIIHVLGAMLWLGGGVFQLFAAGRMATLEGAAALPWAQTMQAASNKYFSRAAMTTLIAGVTIVVLEDGIRFLDQWILIGLGGIAISIAIGAGLIARTNDALVAACGTEVHDEASVTPLLARFRRLALTDFAVQVTVVIAMVAKPGA